MIDKYKNKFNLKNKLAFVAGGTGYIGKEIVKALIAMGCKVVVLDLHKNQNNQDNVKNEFIDLKKVHSLEKNFKKIIKKKWYGANIY